MTFRRTTLHTIASFFCASALVSCLGAHAEIPVRAEVAAGQIALPDGKTSLELTRVVAGFWGRTKLRLLSSGAVLWESGPLDIGLTAGSSKVDDQWRIVHLNVDVDGDGRADWVVLGLPVSWSAAATYDHPVDKVVEITPEGSKTALSQPWDMSVCQAIAGVVILSDLKTVYAFQYDEVRDPFAHRNPYVQGEAHYKRTVGGLPESRLWVTSTLPPKIWSAIRQLVEAHACSTLDSYTHRPISPDLRIKWQAPQEPFPQDDGKQYLAEGLAMYQRALNLHDETAHDLPKEQRGTKYELGMFDFRNFFKAVPFDKVDAENKYPQYTAMLNDFAFYQMAPEVDKADGFEERRIKVEGGVLAILAYVIQRDPRRAVAYLNLGDALWRNSRDQEAARYYRKYVELMKVEHPKAHIPERVLKRMGVD